MTDYNSEWTNDRTSGIPRKKLQPARASGFGAAELAAWANDLNLDIQVFRHRGRAPLAAQWVISVGRWPEDEIREESSTLEGAFEQLRAVVEGLERFRASEDCGPRETAPAASPASPPSLSVLIERARSYVMSPAEAAAQRESWVRGMTARCEHNRVDFEQCPECREKARQTIAERIAEPSGAVVQSEPSMWTRLSSDLEREFPRLFVPNGREGT